jgi:hypothetical protein
MIKRLSGRPDLLLILLSIILVACRTEIEIPTLVPAAQAPPTLLPTSTLVPSSTSTPIVDTPTPTNSPTPTNTPTPTVTPVIPRTEETPFAQSGVNITSPRENAEIVQGHEAFVGGLVQLGPSETLSVILIGATGQTLAAADIDVHQFSNWQGTLDVPLSYSGSARVVARVLDSDGGIIAQDSQAVTLVRNPEVEDRYLDLFRPEIGTPVVAGYNMFFDGWVHNPVNNLITISLWSDNCQVQRAVQSFRLRGSGYWQGFLVIPSNVSGPACAIAHFGEEGDVDRREVQIEVDVLQANADDAVGVLVGNPPPDSVVEPGSTLLLYGTSYNAPNSEVRITILSEDGRLVTEGITSADIFGYWELSLFIPAEAGGVTVIAAEIGGKDDDSYAEHRIITQIEPGS